MDVVVEVAKTHGKEELQEAMPLKMKRKESTVGKLISKEYDDNDQLHSHHQNGSKEMNFRRRAAAAVAKELFIVINCAAIGVFHSISKSDLVF